jgi:hypothetical protein
LPSSVFSSPSVGKDMYLYDPNKLKTAAHLWNDGDTVCKMLGAGGLRLGSKKILQELDGRRVCVMCQNNSLKLQFQFKLAAN